MTNAYKRGLLSTLLISIPLVSGWARAPAVWPIIEISTQSQCAWPARDLALRIFDSNAQWQSMASAGPKPTFRQIPDWQRQVVIAVTLGARPTAGYTIELTGKEFELRQDALWLDFHERPPLAGEIHAQALTQPCIFILAERGKWRHVAARNVDSGATVQADLAN